MPETLLDKIWERHEVAEGLLYVDLHLVHEVTSPQAFESLRLAGRKVRRADRTLATADHNVPTDGSTAAAQIADRLSRVQVETLERNCEEFGAPAFGVGTSEVEHVLATQTLQQRRPRSMRIRYEGELGFGVTAKDLILATIGRIGVDGGVGHVIEYAGPPIEALSMEGRMTVCNMTIEGGGRAGMIAPDDVTFDWFDRPRGGQVGRPAAPAPLPLDDWRELRSEHGAEFDKEVVIDAGQLSPQVTWGTTPGMVTDVTGVVPEPAGEGDERALEYMALEPGTPMQEIELDRVFIGSCTNSRIGDLREAAELVQGARVHPRVQAMVVPGSQQVKAQAEAEGLDEVFSQAGFEWRSAGCSMCLGMNPDILQPGQRCASTSNRNFEGRQGRGGRTHLVSPKMAAAAAVEGHFVDIRDWQ